MKIVQVDDLGIEFDNGSRIVFDYDQYCREDVCVNFEKINDLARSHDYDGELIFEKDPHGFLFGDKRRMFLVPCFSIPKGCHPCFCIHDGCYAGTLYYRGKAVLEFRPENRVQKPADPIK